MDTAQSLRERFWLGMNPSVCPFSRNGLYKLFRDFGFKRGAEIGVSIGINSKAMCTYIAGLELLCVDPWDIVLDDYRSRTRGRERLASYYEQAAQRLKPFDCQLARMTSLEAVRLVRWESLDFVYVDGAHEFDYAITDIVEWSKRVRPGGIVSGHDYLHFSGAGVVEAVDAYVKKHPINEWYLTNENVPSWFWVKPKGVVEYESPPRSIYTR